MSRIMAIARREFAATAMTKGFIIGAIIIPLLATAMIPLIFILLMRAPQPQVTGSVAIIDKSGAVREEITRLLSTEAIAARHAEQFQQAAEMVAEKAKGTALEGQIQQGMETGKAALPPVEHLTIETLPADADLASEQTGMRGKTAQDKGRLAIVVVSPDAIVQDPALDKFGGYEIYHIPKLDDRVVDDIRYAAREAIRSVRLTTNGLEPARVKTLNTVEADKIEEVTLTGTTKSTNQFTQLLPIGFMVLLMLSVMVEQYLLTTTIEEKSNRVVEVLLSAVSPMQLMAGKIIGQMLVGLTLLVMYSGVSMGALAAFSLAYLVDGMTLAYLFIFFLIAYFLFASMFAAVGSAVSDLREAQSLQTPVMLTMMIPYFLWLPISRDPNSVLSVTLSFLPPMSPFVMMLRLTSTAPPPTWQVLLSILIGMLAVLAAIWMAAKIFKVGLLMYGKPPNFATLIKWIRMA